MSCRGIPTETIVRRLLYYPRLRLVAEYVVANLDRPVRLSDAAAAAIMQESAFSRYFTAKVGITFSDFVRTLRVLRAIEMIEAEDCTFKELARVLGFRTVSTFARNFHATFGCSPREYKRLALANSYDQRAAARRRHLLQQLSLLHGGKREPMLPADTPV